jgi:hypothetical protein
LLKSQRVSITFKKMEQQNIDNQVNEKQEEKKRPTAITVICVLGFIGAGFTIPLIFSDIAGQIASWYPTYLGLSAIIGLSCMFGLWQMKKWAAYTYIGFVVLNQIVLLTMGSWNIMAILIPAIIIGITLTHINKMN